MNLGQLIRQRRLSLGLTQAELGKKIGVSKMAISKYENNITERMSRENTMKLSTLLDIPIIRFIKDDENIEYEEVSRDEFILELQELLKDKQITDEQKKYLLDTIKYIIGDK